MNLEDYRAEIDRIDRGIVDLFQERMELSAQIAQYKKEHGLPTLDAGREQAKLESLAAMSKNELASCVQQLYRSVFAISRDYQDALRVQEP